MVAVEEPETDLVVEGGALQGTLPLLVVPTVMIPSCNILMPQSLMFNALNTLLMSVHLGSHIRGT